MKRITTFFLFMTVFMGSGANAQQAHKGNAFFAKFDPTAQALVQEHGPEKMVTVYLDKGIYAKYWRISQADLAELIYSVCSQAEEMGYSNPVDKPEDASKLFSAPNYATLTVAELKQFGIKRLKIGYMLDGKVTFDDKALSDLDDAVEFGGLYDANNAHFFPIIKKGIKGSGKECCFNICYPKQEDDAYVNDGDGGGPYSDKTVQRSGDGVVINNYNIIENSGNSSSDQSQEQEQEQTAPAPAPQQQQFVPAQISYQEVPMQMSQPINYNPGYPTGGQMNTGNAGCCNNKANGAEVITAIASTVTAAGVLYGAYKSWQIYNKPAPIINVTGGNTTYGNNSYNSGVYGNGLLPTYTGPGGGTGTGGGGGPIDIGNGGPGND
jgi:hypothetical protein